MKHIGFVTCSDLNRYFPSKENPLLTHDDFLAYEFLEKKGYKVSTWVWTGDLDLLQKQNFDLLVVRSPWDYADDENTRNRFVEWLHKLKELKLNVVNPIDLMLWNLDKHYLKDMESVGAQIVPSLFWEACNERDLKEFWNELGPFVIKPCISAAARDTYRVLNLNDLEKLESKISDIRSGRSFLVQPYLKGVETQGEWSLIFLNGEYSHALLKKPKPGSWFVQDELGGSVTWINPPKEIIDSAIRSFNLIEEAFKKNNTDNQLAHKISYARVDLMLHADKNYLSELEMIEPELFFLDRSVTPHKPHSKALHLFSQSLESFL